MSDRKKHDKKYWKSEKGKENYKKSHAWDVKKTYYACKPCLCCGQVKKIVSRGLCNACRQRKKRNEQSS